MNSIKSRFKIVVLCFLTSSSVYGQIQHAGIQLKYNFSNHLRVEKDTPTKFARSLQGRLSSPGADIYADFGLDERLIVRTKLGYETRGLIGSYMPIVFEHSAFKFDHLTLDANLMCQFGNGIIKPYGYLGFTTGFLLQKKLPEWPYYWDYSSLELPYENYNKFTLGLLMGFGLDINELLWVEFEFNRDFIANNEVDTYKEYNHIFTVQAGINILKFFKK